MRFVGFFLLDSNEERAGLCSGRRKEGGKRRERRGRSRRGENVPLECLSASAALARAETGALWERQQRSGEFCAAWFTGGEACDGRHFASERVLEPRLKKKKRNKCEKN